MRRANGIREQTAVRRTTSEMLECFVCGYSLAGHGGSFRCPECGTEYDRDTVVWYSPVSMWSLYGRSYAVAIWLVWFVVIVAARLISRGSDTVESVLVLTTIALVVGVSWHSRALRRLGRFPYVGATPSGIVFSRSGLRFKHRFRGWADVEKQTRKVGSGWGLPEGILHDLGVTLNPVHAKELFSTVQQKTRAQRAGGAVVE